MAVLELESLTKRFGRAAAIDDLSLTIDYGRLPRSADRGSAWF